MHTGSLTKSIDAGPKLPKQQCASHKPGEAMQVDWAGNTIPVYDSVTGESSPAYLFVGVLPCSCFVYVEACSDMRSENWLACHVHAFNYFQGVPQTAYS